MKQIERELERIGILMRGAEQDDRYCQLYAAQQALSWALDPEGYAAPSITILDGKVQPLTGILANSADCLDEARHSAS